MANSNLKKQAKSDIFKELNPIISFYIKKGAKAKSLKKYYNNKKRFKELLSDIKNKGINLVEDEEEYNKLVKSTLHEILDDIIAQEKDAEYNSKSTTQKNSKSPKMKHIKEFNSFDMNEGFSWLLTVGAAIFFLKFINGLLKHRKFSKMSQEEIEDYKNNKKNYRNFLSLVYYVRQFINDGGKINFSENIINYVFELGEVTIKINKNNKTIEWSNLGAGKFLKYKPVKRVEFNDFGDEIEYEFTKPIPISQDEIDGLITAIKKDNEE